MGQTTEPLYYKRGSIPVWDFIRDQGLSFHLGNAIKYICRAGHKEDASFNSDLRKAITYLQNELEHVTIEQQRDRIPTRVQREEFLNFTNDAEEFDR
jgi:hypothetical protein